MFEYLMANAWKRQECPNFKHIFKENITKQTFIYAPLFEYFSPETEKKRKCMSIGMHAITKNC